MYNWREIEKKAGKLVKDKYKETGSLRKTGKFFGEFIGLSQGISSLPVRAELVRQGVKINGLGGCNFKGKEIAFNNYQKILSLKDLEKKTSREIKALTGITEGQFLYYVQKYRFKYNNSGRHAKNWAQICGDHECKNKFEVVQKLYAKYQSQWKVGYIIGCSQFYVCQLLVKGDRKQKSRLGSDFKGVGVSVHG